ncbi:MAG: formylglycine-generating enzyme family protein [Planctomycetaceae bacterium]
MLKEFRAAWTTEWNLTDLRRFLEERVGRLAPMRLSVILLDQELRWLAGCPVPISQYIENLPELRRQPTSLLELSIAQERLRETVLQRNALNEEFSPASVGRLALQFYGEKREPIAQLLDPDYLESRVLDQVSLPAHVPLLSDFGTLGATNGAGDSIADAEDQDDAEDVSLLMLAGVPAPPSLVKEWLHRSWNRIEEFAPWVVGVGCAVLVLLAGTSLALSWLTPRMEGGATGVSRHDNGLELPLVWIDPGWSLLGSPDGEMGRYSNESQVEVRFTTGYWIGRYEVTQDQFQKIMYSNPSHFSPTGAGRQVVRDLKPGNLPVENVSPDEVREFCRRMTAIERQAKRLPPDWEYTLPTEAQWEHAARAGGRLAYGDSSRLPSDRAHYDQPETGSPRGAGPGGQGTPNSWGLHDMLGNVAEICRDSYRDELTSGTDPLADFAGDPVVIRGGSWKSSLPNCRPAWRDRWGRKHRSEWLGFRLVLVKVPPELLVKR